MVELDPKHAALVAVGQATDANASLIRFFLEGPFNDSAPFEDEVVARFAEATLRAIEIELGTNRVLDTDEQEALGQLGAACAKFIEGWVG
ncbi:MAG: hypothetical protein K2Y20_05430 [Sphingomonas sp.]|nr:hypothetical protein [Sphingomonas sp.]